MSAAADPLAITLPYQWTFAISNIQYLNLGPFVDGTTLANLNPTYLNSLTVTASLYQGRNLQNPATTPGTLVGSWGNSGVLTCGYVAGSSGLYQGTVANTFTTTPYLSYALVIDASGGSYIGHWEFPANIVVRNS